MARWPSGLRRYVKAVISPEARVRISLESSFDKLSLSDDTDGDTFGKSIISRFSSVGRASD